MVQLEPRDDGSVRYRLLEPLRQFARERLVERGELDDARRRQALAMASLVEEAGRELEGPRQVAWFRRLDAEWDNVRVAHEWAEAAADAETAMRLAAPLWMYWSRPSRQAEGRGRLARVLAIGDALVPGIAGAPPVATADAPALVASRPAVTCSVDAAAPPIGDASALATGDGNPSARGAGEAGAQA